MSTRTQAMPAAPAEKKESLFEGLSMSQILAGALAACTSTLFASQIGIAGSIIGVAVGSIVSTVASQIYKHFLTSSANRMANAARNLSGKTVNQDEQESDSYGYETATDSRQVIGSTHASSAQETLARAHAQRKLKHRIQVGTIVVAVVAALLAIAVSGAAINLITAGEGLGEKTAPIFTTDEDGNINLFDSGDQESDNDAGKTTGNSASSANANSNSDTSTSNTGTNTDAGTQSGNNADSSASNDTASSSTDAEASSDSGTSAADGGTSSTDDSSDAASTLNSSGSASSSTSASNANGE